MWHILVSWKEPGKMSLEPDPTPPQVLYDTKELGEGGLTSCLHQVENQENYHYGQLLTAFATNYIFNKKHDTD